LAALFVVAALSPDPTAAPCTVVQAAVPLREVPEASGLAVSRGRPGLLWTHNDSGNEPDLFAIQEDGAARGRVRLALRARDWEDISAAPCPRTGRDQGNPGDCLYIGDIGDNAMSRRNVQIYIVPDIPPGAAPTGRPRRLNVTYPDGAHNAEAMFIAGGRLFIITKDRTGLVYGSTSPLGDSETVTLQRVTQLDLAGVTDAEAAADEQSVAVRTSNEVIIYRTLDLLGGGKVPQGMRIPIDGLREPQGEGVALGDNGMLYLASEGRPWNGAGRLVSLRCPTHLP
jgi:hypothetical protein